MNLWPKKPTMWITRRRLNVSVPFTWNLPALKQFLTQRSSVWDSALVGGPAVKLIPDYFDGMDWVEVSCGSSIGVLQRVNPMATKTTEGCVRSCRFCGIGIGKIEPGGLRELSNWLDLPIICDNNLLAASPGHIDKVMDRLEKHSGVDFNQGLDARLLTPHHAIRLSKLNKPKIRLSCDNLGQLEKLGCAIETLRNHGVPKSSVSSYALVGFDSSPDEAWNRCNEIESVHKIKAYPMWFHELYALDFNCVTLKQAQLGWNDYERRRIMQWFYQHKKAVRYVSEQTINMTEVRKVGDK